MRRKTIIFEIAKIIVNSILVPLYFIKFFCDEAVHPGFNEFGEEIIVKHYFYYSIFDKITREGISCLLWGAIAISIASIILSVLSMTIRENKTIKIASHIVFGVAIVLFFILLFIAWTIRYDY